MSRRINIEGQRFGRLVAKRVHEVINRVTYWECECDCGNISNVCLGSLKGGNTKSCGCLNSEKSKERGTKHGLCGTRLINIYFAMKHRCLRKNCKQFKDYGGRGIIICEEWLNKDNGFINFYNWALSNGYSEKLTIDRINNNGNYEPSNCKWSTYSEQNSNKRNSRFVDFNGEHKTIAEWEKELGVSNGTIRHRIYKSGWDIEKALKTKVNKGGLYAKT
jgi:hypothetical protein